MCILFGWSLLQDSEETIHIKEKNNISYKWAAYFHWDKAKKKKILKKKIKMADSKKTHFSAPPILNIFLLKLHGLVLGLVGLIDA